MYNIRVFYCSSKARIFVLVVRPSEVIKVHVLMYISVLGIVFESYGHVLGPPRVSSDFEKKYFFPFFKPFFNGLNGKIQNVKKCDTESIFGVVGLIFKLEAASLPKETLSLCFGQIKHPERHYLTIRASKWLFNAKS